MASDLYNDLIQRMRRVNDLRGARNLLSWEQETYMPPKAAAIRARQISTLSAIAHTEFVSAETGKLLDALQNGAGAGLDATGKAVVAELRYDFERARRLPESLVAEVSEATGVAFSVWQEARAKSDFAMFKPHLKRIVELQRKRAEAFGYDETPYDALIEEFERGMRASAIRPLFAGLREKLAAMIRQFVQKPGGPTRKLLAQPFDEDKQWQFGMSLLRDIGFDLEAGRQDRSSHPFTSNTHPTDVRLTTRVNANDLSPALYATLHEAGHGLYEQGYPREYWDTALADAPSLGIHESQSLMWEDMLGRSRGFCRRYFPRLATYFPQQLRGATAEDFYRAVNVVEASFIRVEADELTYIPHIILRFELEQGLIEGDIEVDDLPRLWAEKMESLLGVVPPKDAQGVLQDVHWSHGAFGYFPTYALGRIYAAQLHRKMTSDLGSLESLVEAGNFAKILGWLRTNIHAKGRTLSASALIEQVCGEPLNPQPFLDYAAKKFGDVYA